MKRPEFRPLAREDVPEAPWIEKLTRPLNAFLSQVAAGLGNGLTLGENLNAEVKTIDVTTQDEWIPLALTAPWTAAAFVPAYRKAGRRVELRGTVTRNAATSGSAAFTLPAATVPAVGAPQFTLAAYANLSAIIAVGPNTAILFYAGTPNEIHLNGVAYDAADETAGANPAFPVKFTTKVRGKVAGVVLFRCVEMVGRDARIVHSPLSIGWEQNAQTVELRSVAGLAGGKTYRLTLALFGE